jgi:hypothetical protein
MVITSDFLAILIALLGVITSSSIGYLVYLSNKQAQRAETQREISHLYEKLMDFRVEYPEVLMLSRIWKMACFRTIYRQKSKKDRQWAIYYTYAELCMSFCNTVIYGEKLGFLNKVSYQQHYKLLVKLILTEHYPFVTSVLNGKYLSPHIQDFLKEGEKDGWNWQDMHQELSRWTK